MVPPGTPLPQGWEREFLERATREARDFLPLRHPISDFLTGLYIANYRHYRAGTTYYRDENSYLKTVVLTLLRTHHPELFTPNDHHRPKT